MYRFSYLASRQLIDTICCYSTEGTVKTTDYGQHAIRQVQLLFTGRSIFNEDVSVYNEFM